MARENEDPVEPEVHNMDELNQKETPSTNVPADANLVWKAFSIVFMMIAVAYAALPFDAFPDAVPVIGWLDDAAVLIAAGLNMFQQFSRDQNSPTVKLVRYVKWIMILLVVLAGLLIGSLIAAIIALVAG